MGPDQHILADPSRMGGTATHQGVLHDHAAGTDLDAPILGGEDRPEQHARLGPHVNIAAENRRGSNVSAGIDHRHVPSMLDEHPHPLPEAGREEPLSPALTAGLRTTVPERAFVSRSLGYPWMTRLAWMFANRRSPRLASQPSTI